MNRTWKKPALAGLATLAALGLAATAPIASRADSPYTTVAVTGFNKNVVQTSNSQSRDYVDVYVQLVLSNETTALTYPGITGGGLPDNGSITSLGTGAPFQLAPYTDPSDVLQVSTNANLYTQDTTATPNVQPEPQTASLTLTTPGQYSSIGVLWAAGYGPSLADVTFNYSDSTTQVYLSQSVYDWGSIPTGVARAANIGRIDMRAGHIGLNPRSTSGGQSLFDSYFTVDPTKTLESVTFTDTHDNVGGANNEANSVKGLYTVFAINGIAAAPEPGETVALMLGGLGLLGLVARKRRASA